MTILYTQIEVGTFTQFFSLPFNQYGHLPSIATCFQLWNDLEPDGIIIKPSNNCVWTPEPICPGDESLTDIVV